MARQCGNNRLISQSATSRRPSSQDNIIAVWLLQCRLHNSVCVSHRSLYSAPWLLGMITADHSSKDIPIKGRHGKRCSHLHPSLEGTWKHLCAGTFFLSFDLPVWIYVVSQPQIGSECIRPQLPRFCFTLCAWKQISVTPSFPFILKYSQSAPPRKIPRWQKKWNDCIIKQYKFFSLVIVAVQQTNHAHCEADNISVLTK